MATWNTIIREIAIRINALGVSQTAPAATTAQIQTVYETVPLTVNNIYSTIFSFTAIKDAAIDAESALVQAVADTANHPWRSLMLSQTSSLTYGQQIPSTDSSSKPRIGVIGAVIDTTVTPNEPCTLNQLEQIRDRVYNPNNMWKIPVWWYAVNDDRIYHTAPSVMVDVCTYTRPAADSLTLTSSILLPDVVAPAYVDGALMRLVRDDEFTGQAGMYGQIFNGWIARIKQGLTSWDTSTRLIDHPPQEAVTA